MAALSDFTTPYTSAQVQAQIYTGIAAQGVSTTSWKPGAVTRTIISVVSVVIAAFSTLIGLIASGGFLDLSVGSWLTLKALYDYGVDRTTGALAGSFATGNILASNSTAGIYTGNPGDLVVLNPTTGQQYRNTASFMIGAFAANVSIPVSCTILGSVGSSGPGTITTLVTVYSGVTVTNAVALTGTDATQDAPLRVLCRQKLGALSPNGAFDAYGYTAKNATRLADGTAIGVTRVHTIPDGIGGVDCYIATASGAIPGAVGNTATDLGQVDALLQKAVVPLAVTLRSWSATTVAIAVTCDLWVRNTSGMTDAQIQAAVSTAIQNYFASVPIGGEQFTGSGFVYASAITAAIASVLPTLTVRVTLTLPAADVALTATQVPVLGAYTCNMHQFAEVTS